MITVARQLLQDERQKYSSTRLCLFLALCVWIVAFAAETFGGKPVNPEVYNVLQLVLPVGLAATGVRGYAASKNGA